MTRKYKKVEQKIESIGRVSRELGDSIAQEMMLRLNPYCEKIMICGSVRRREETVKDVEVVCIPKMIAKPDLFGDTEDLIRHPGFVSRLNEYRCEKGKREDGKQIKLIHPTGVPIDIFVVDHDNYGMEVFKRTGPKEVSKMIFGWSIKRRGFESRDNHLYNCKANSYVSVPEERDFFNTIGLTYRHPADRMIGESQYRYYGDEGITF